MSDARPSIRSFRLAGKLIVWLFSPEEIEVQRAQEARLPHAHLIPMLQAARAARHRYVAWGATWDDPAV